MPDPIPLLDSHGCPESDHLDRDDDRGFGALSTSRGFLPLKAMDVKARIDGLIASVDLSQTFVNNCGEPIEATYIFPLPDNAAVTSFRMEAGGRVVEGRIDEREKAREDYDEAVVKGHRAAIAEEERPGVFTLRVGNILAGEAATIRLSFSGPLALREGEAEWRFPLVVAPRYIPGTPLDGTSVGIGVAVDTDQVPDASRITPPILLPGYPNPVRLELSVEINVSAIDATDLRASLHSIVEESADNGWRRIRLQPGERLNRDFILRFQAAGESVKSAIAIERDPGPEGRGGSFLLTLVPPAKHPNAHRPRDMIFLLDRSGSMQGWKLTAARRAVERMVETLGESDRVAVYAFDNAVETSRTSELFELYPATSHERANLAVFLSRVEARGGTEIARPLIEAVNRLNAGEGSSGRDRILVLVTDGQIGNEDQILRELGGKLANIRVFALGIDSSVNAGFLKRLAVAGGGDCELIESEERLDKVTSRIHRLIGTPVLTGLRVTGRKFDIEAGSVSPERLPDLFASVPLLISGRWSGAVEGIVELEARDGEGRKWRETLTPVEARGAAAGTVWARARIRDLEDRFAAATDPDMQQACEKQILEISLRHKVLSRFTAFVAIDLTEAANPGGRVHVIPQAVELPEGWDMRCCSKAVLGAHPLSAARFFESGLQGQSSVYSSGLDFIDGMAATSLRGRGKSGPKLLRPLLAHLIKLFRENLKRNERGGGLKEMLESIPSTFPREKLDKEAMLALEILLKAAQAFEEEGASREETEKLLAEAERHLAAPVSAIARLARKWRFWK